MSFSSNYGSPLKEISSLDNVNDYDVIETCMNNCDSNYSCVGFTLVSTLNAGFLVQPASNGNSVLRPPFTCTLWKGSAKCEEHCDSNMYIKHGVEISCTGKIHYLHIHVQICFTIPT